MILSSHESKATQQRCVSEQGFSAHAEVRCAMNQRNKIEQLCGETRVGSKANTWYRTIQHNTCTDGDVVNRSRHADR